MFVTHTNEIESKGFQFPVAEMPLIKLIGLAVNHDSSKTSALVPQEHQIRMHSDKCNNLAL